MQNEVHQPGTGGGLGYLLEEATGLMLNQERSHSCQLACARQLLKEVGIEVTEELLADRIGYVEGWGTSAEETAQIIDLLHPLTHYVGGAVEDKAFFVLCQGQPWIASLRTDHGSVHAVIVDRFEDGLVHVRDPWGTFGPGSGTGTRATMTLDSFQRRWRLALNNTVFATAPKDGGNHGL